MANCRAPDTGETPARARPPHRSPLAWGLLAAIAFLLVAPFHYPSSVPSGTAPQGVPVLMYHKVNPDRSTGGWGLRVHPREFEWQMGYLASRGYTAITPDQLWAHLNHGAPLPPKPVLITFDDGYHDNYVCAYPIVREYGFVATVFVVANAVERTNYFDAATQPVNVMLSWDEIRALDAAGWTIGAHTLDHPPLTAVGPARAEREVRGAREVLAEGLGRPVHHFCYPYGEFNDHTVRTVAASGYMLAFTTVQGRVEAADDPHTLKRLRVTGRTSRAQFARLLEAEHLNLFSRLAGGRLSGAAAAPKENSPLSGEPSSVLDQI